MAALQDMLYFMLAGLILLLLEYLVINFVTKGFLTKFFMVKASRGKKVMVEVLGTTSAYATIGTPMEGELVYKDRSKHKKRASVSPANFISKWGLETTFVDEEHNAIIDFRDEFAASASYDNSKADRLVSRILSMPLDDKTKMIMIIVGVGALLAALGAAFLSFQSLTASQQMPALVQTIADACAANIV